MKQRICLLGATGSIGASTLDILAQHPETFELFAISAYSKVEPCLKIIQMFHPKLVVMVDPMAANALRDAVQALKLNTEILCGEQALVELASLSEVDTVVAAIVGAAGLPSVLAAAKAGKRILLANKEALVMTGSLMMSLIKTNQATLLPIDSEHNALFQCLPSGSMIGEQPKGVQKLILTASGGPFLHTPAHELCSVSPAQAVKHPNWSMGAKISVDSATMMNKALEVIEAHYLFNMPNHLIEVLIHPESIVHSFVVYDDGSYLAQLGSHDMRIPISSALSWPTRIKNRAPFLDLRQKPLTFSDPNPEQFPCLQLAFEALRAGGLASCILNAANEQAVIAFMSETIRFDQIAVVNKHCLNYFENETLRDVEQVLDVDSRVRHVAKQFSQSL